MKFSKDNVSDYEEILSTQEEADIRRLSLTLCYPFETKARRYWLFWNRSGEKAVQHHYQKI
jgi:hypothetical protein